MPTLHPHRPRSLWRSASAWLVVGVAYLGWNLHPAPPSPQRLQSSPPAENPLLAAVGVRADETAFVGRVVARLPAGHYTYLEIGPVAGTSSDRRWIATMGAGAKTGQVVHARTFSARDDFFSRRLARHFDRVLFGIVEPQPTPRSH